MTENINQAPENIQEPFDLKKIMEKQIILLHEKYMKEDCNIYYLKEFQVFCDVYLRAIQVL